MAHTNEDRIMQANVHQSQTVKHELMLDRIDINQQQTELLQNKLLDAIASARSNMLEDMAQSADYFDGDYKDMAVLSEHYFKNACVNNGIVVEVLSDAFSCPRNPAYKCFFKERPDIFVTT